MTPSPLNPWTRAAFDVDVSDVEVPATIAMPTTCEPELFFDGDRFLLYIHHHFEEFDVATFSYSSAGKRLKIRRLITGLPLSRLHGLNFKEHKRVRNNHCKLFLCYKKDQPVVAYIGSQNLTAGTNINLMVRIDPKYINLMMDFFNQMWTGKIA